MSFHSKCSKYRLNFNPASFNSAKLLVIAFTIIVVLLMIFLIVFVEFMKPATAFITYPDVTDSSAELSDSDNAYNQGRYLTQISYYQNLMGDREKFFEALGNPRFVFEEAQTLNGAYVYADIDGDGSLEFIVTVSSAHGEAVCAVFHLELTPYIHPALYSVYDHTALMSCEGDSGISLDFDEHRVVFEGANCGMIVAVSFCLNGNADDLVSTWEGEIEEYDSSNFTGNAKVVDPIIFNWFNASKEELYSYND